MKVKQLQLQNYGRFDNLTMEFAPNEETKGNVTIIVGNNGAGKSQILQALAIALSQFVSSISKNIIKNNILEIEKKSILNGKNESEIAITVSDLSTETSWKVYANKNNGIGATFFKPPIFNNLIENYKQILNSPVDSIRLPLIVFYPVERAILGDSEAIISDFDDNPLNGYINSFEGMSIQFSNFLQWFREQEDIENEKVRIKSNQFRDTLSNVDIQNQYDKTRKKIKQLGEQVEKETNVNRQAKLLLQQMELNIKLAKLLEQKIVSIENNFNTQSTEISKLSSIKKAISDFTDFKNPRIRRQGTPTMIVEKDSAELDVNQLSQGEKSLLALVGDIARRLAILNPSLDNPLQGKGVVLIDEVDLHLHPKWQQNLIDKLTKTFPNVQFILTTHSPHIVSDNPDVLVYILDDGELRPYNNAYGEDVNTLLNGVFGVSERTPEIAEKFKMIGDYISDKQLDNAKNLIDELSQILSKNHTHLLRTQLTWAKAKLDQSKEV